MVNLVEIIKGFFNPTERNENLRREQDYLRAKLTTQNYNLMFYTGSLMYRT